MTMKLCARIALIVAGVLTSQTAWASTIGFSSFGPGYSYQKASAFPVYGDGDPSGLIRWGSRFSVSQDIYVDLLTAAGGWVAGNSRQMSFYLTTDTAAGPGTTLETWTFDPLPTFDANNGQALLQGGSTLRPLLTANTLYWMVVGVPVASNEWAYWNAGAASGQTAIQREGGAWEVYPFQQTLGAFEVQGTPTVPEPSTMILIGSGIGGMLLRRRRQRDAANRSGE
jgi:hypothetical protein